MHANRIAGMLVMGLGAFAVWGAFRLPLGKPSAPEPGFVPLVEGILLVRVGLWLVAESVSRPAEKVEWPAGEAKRMGCYLSAAMLGYLVLMPVGGFTLSTFLFLTVTIRAWRRYSTPAAIIFAALITLVIYATFGVALGMPLPRGPYDIP